MSDHGASVAVRCGFVRKMESTTGVQIVREVSGCA